MEPAIVAQKLSKTYCRRKRGSGLWGGLKSYFSTACDQVEAVQEISFRVERGESIGLIGENGAGKSTTIKMLTGILVPTGGEVRSLGLNPWRQRRKLAMNIGVVFGQKPQLLWDIPAGESFKLLKAMYAIPDEIYRFTYGEAVERLELGELLRTPVRLLSLGQRMRCDLAAALLHAPAVAFLDEPTIGLDVLVKERVRELLREMRRRYSTTIMLTTHDLRDITAIADRLLVLDRGRLLYDGDLSGFTARFGGGRTLLVELERAPGADLRRDVEHQVAALDARVAWEASGLRARVECPTAAAAPKLTGLLLQRLAVCDLSLQGTEIDAVVSKLYRKGAEA